MKKFALITICFAVLCIAAGGAVADMLPPGQTTLVYWDQDYQPGNQVSTPGTTGSTYITAIDMTRGDGLTPSSYNNTFASTGWNSFATNDYVQFGFTVAQGYQAILTGLWMELWSATPYYGTGPGTIGLYGSSDNFATQTLLYTYNFPSGGYNEASGAVDLSSLQNITGTYLFRLVEIGTNGAGGGTTQGGALEVDNYYVGSGTYYVNSVTGSVAPVPVPSALWMLGSGLVGLAGMRRRGRK